MTVIVISGTGTGVGKTVVTAAICALALARGTRVAVVKPAQTGVSGYEPGDLAEVARLCGSTAEHLSLIEGSRFPDPLSPAAAARTRHQVPADLTAMASDIAGLTEDHPLVLVEGAGGLLVRYDEEGATIADLAAACHASVLVVTEAGLGSLNATALTLEAMAHRGLDLTGLVIGSWPAEPDLACRSNVSDLEMLAARPLGGAIAEGAGALDSKSFLSVAGDGLCPALGGRFRPGAFRTHFRHSV